MGNNIRIFTAEADVEILHTFVCMLLYVTWQYLVFKRGSVLDKVSKIFQTGHPTREQIDLYNIGFFGLKEKEEMFRVVTGCVMIAKKVTTSNKTITKTSFEVCTLTLILKLFDNEFV